ncbi:LysM peptidoglycan-binding domain-containing protein [Lacticaseibacillus saniviri]|uniref:LysM peptidoglycan-binding domain-containing protein n=1 Tax=Lacticaseibacillus saniviri TaxID=931533 RepID=UPI0006CFAA7D|nr:LysM peptidoglycan-binding domain-containing protein [Lacticaseibacillus saniviri]MCG4282595.1 LysM peptidoglycan-binding domain-containing protein [Lacticaseibacillus saniviri]
MKIKTLLFSTAAALTLGVAGLSTSTTHAAVNNGNGTVTVEAGDTYMSIANAHSMSVASLETLNGRTVGGYDLIHPGEIVKVGGTATQATTQNTTTTQAQPAQQTQQATQTQAATTTNTAATASTTTNYGSDLKSYVLNKMVAATGVSASTWDAIITRESNWQSTAQNPSSSAHGLFQSLWINGSNSVDTQISDAIRLYNAAGLSPWAL